jgi:flagellar hook protein FlgE
MAGFNTAITGIKAATTMLDVTGNNVANSSTVGFKSYRTEFSDLYTKSVIGSGAGNTVGSGVGVADISQDFSGGTLEYTSNNLDLAINGSGFFQVADPEGKLFYTRAGSFELDKEGHVMTKSGKNLRGYGMDALGNQLPLQNLQVSDRESPPKATEIMELAFNIDASSEAADLNREFSKSDANSYTYSATVGTYSSVGEEQTVRSYFVEQRPFKEVFSFDASNAVTSAPLMTAPATYTGEVMELSGLQFNATPGPGTLQFDPATHSGGRTYLDAGSKVALMVQDPRIDPSSVYYNFANDTLNFENHAEFSQYGEMMVSHTGTTRNNVLLGDNSERPANEVQQFSLDPANFTSGGGADQLGSVATISIGGVAITLPGTSTISQVGETINAYEASIISVNPDIESVRYTSTAAGHQINVTWKAEVGAVTSTFPLSEIAGTVFTDADANGAPDVVELANGDNSYLSAYRMYSFLNDEDQLNLGKAFDPGASSPTATEEGAIMINFNTSTGALKAVNGQSVSLLGNAPPITILGADPGNPTDAILDSDVDSLQGIQLNLTGSSQFSAASIIKSVEQDGRTKGDLTGVGFSETGEMIASFSNGEDTKIGVVTIANFSNQNALQAAGSTEWIETLDSGQAITNPPLTALNGSIKSSALEQSNVDLSSELVKLIQGQRNFQANSKTLETINTITQTILQI